MLEFSKLKGGSKYPQRDFPSNENQSYGFTPAYKVQSGESRGEQTVRGIIRIVNSDGTVVMIMGYKEGEF